MSRWRLVTAAAMGQLLLVSLPPMLLCGPAVTPPVAICMTFLVAAAVFETLLAERQRPSIPEPLPLLMPLSAAALLCGFWLALAQALAIHAASITAARLLGGAALLGGIGLRVAAMSALGSDFVSAHRAGSLVTSGLYGVLRHPSETGQLLLAAGAALMLGSNWSALWFLAVIAPLTLWRLHQEEAVLIARHKGYVTYRRRVDGLVPLRFLGRMLSNPVRG
jgi:protein-S-isoprenylcysteine O-methyltransferase Ste14